jgi:hypothetical protein
LDRPDHASRFTHHVSRITLSFAVLDNGAAQKYSQAGKTRMCGIDAPPSAELLDFVPGKPIQEIAF